MISELKINEILDLVADDKMKVALNELKLISHKIPDKKDEILILLARHKSYLKSINLNIVPRNELQIELNQIRGACISFASSLRNKESKYDIFLCYNIRDYQNILSFYLHLQNWGYKVFLNFNSEENEFVLQNAYQFVFFIGSDKGVFKTKHEENYINKIYNKSEVKIFTILLKEYKKDNIPIYLLNKPTFQLSEFNLPTTLSILKDFLNGTVPIFFDSQNHKYNLSNGTPKGFQANIPNVIKLLIGESLYKRRDVAIRELIQNAVDACERKYYPPGLNPSIEVKVHEDYFVSVR